MAEISGGTLNVGALQPDLVLRMQANPAEVASKWQTLQGQMLNNRLLGQQVRGKEELGHIIGRNTKADGEVDWSKVAAEAGKSPAASILLPEIQKAATERQQAMLGLDKSQLELSAARWKLAGDTVGALLADKTPLTKQAVIANLQNNLIGSGMFNNPESRQQLVSLVQSLPDDDAGIRKVLGNVALQSNMTQERLAMMIGAPQDVDLGNVVANKQVSPLTGDTRINAALPKGLSPERLATTVTVIDPVTKEQKIVTLGSLLGQPVGGGGVPAAAGGARNGRYPSASGIESGGVTTGLAPGVQPSMEKSAEVYQTDLAAQREAGQRLQGLQIAQEALAKAPTGKGSEPWQDARRVMETLGIPMLPGDEEKTLSYAKAAKYLQDYANRRGQSMGLGTDAAREMVKQANPGVDTPNPAAQDMVQVIIGLERMGVAQMAAAERAKVTPGDYTAWASRWNRGVDPWGFAADQPSAAKYYKTLKTETQRQKYFRSVADAVNAGLFTLQDVKR